MPYARPSGMLINIDVPDLPAAIRFYADGLGLEPRRMLFDGTVAELGGAAVAVYLLQKEPGSQPGLGIAEGRTYRRHWTPVHFDLIVADVEAAVARAVAAGAQLEGAIETFAWGRQAVMSDPFGNGFCFLQWSGEGYGAVASGAPPAS